MSPAFPTNAQPELHGAKDFNSLGLAPAKALAERFGVEAPAVLSQRDVPGLTRAIVPLLAAAGVTGISIGANDGSPAPLVPSTVDCYTRGRRQVRTPFVWRDVASNSSVIMDIHAGGKMPPAAVSSLSNLCCLSCSKSGYGGVTGGHDPGGPPYFSRDGLLCDCLGVAGLDDVLCYAWRGDNYGPATLAEVELNYQKFG